MEKETLKIMFYIFILLLFALKILLESLFEKHPPPVGHNTGIILLIGVFCSWIILQMSQNIEDGKSLLSNLKFSDELFFELILPAIVFPSGYNMRRKKFFRNIGPIFKFGIFGTIICFIIYSAALAGVQSLGLLTKY